MIQCVLIRIVIVLGAFFLAAWAGTFSKQNRERKARHKANYERMKSKLEDDEPLDPRQ